MRRQIKCEFNSPTYKKIKPKHIEYNGEKWMWLCNLHNVACIIKINKKDIPYGIIEKVPLSDIFM